MKKYFLLIPVVALLFLGLGKISGVEAANGVICKAKASTVVNHIYTCEVGPHTSNDPANRRCKAGVEQCTQEDCNSPAMCCICDPDPVTPPITNPSGGTTTNPSGGTTTSNVGAACDSIISGGKLNQRGKCACPTGTKRVKNKCELCTKKGVCCGISLNTSVPFIGKCIEDTTGSVSPDETNVTGETAFPVLMGSLTKILVTVILILSFVLIIIGGIMITTGDPSGGKKMIIRVVIGIALLGASGVILRLINPNFFG